MRTLATLLFLLLTSQAMAGEIVVIANPESGLTSLSREDAINIFMGRYRTLPNGRSAVPLDLPAEQSEHRQFYELLVGKTPAQINAYWARLLFTGRAARPQLSSNASEVVGLVASHGNAIGYVERRMVDKRVRIVLELTTP